MDNAAFAAIAAYSTTLAPEAAYYWERHAVRYRYMVKLLTGLAVADAPTSILDVGMGFETLLLKALFPEARLDCLGMEQDERFTPPGGATFHRYDLNDAAVPGVPVPPIEVKYDLIVFMEVLEHLITPPASALRFLSSLLSPRGHLLITTPNAAWLKNRWKMVRGRNPFERLKPDRNNPGHIREYTKDELISAIAESGMQLVAFERRGLYHFDNLKDNVYSRMADLIHPSLRRTLVAVARRG